MLAMRRPPQRFPHLSPLWALCSWQTAKAHPTWATGKDNPPAQEPTALLSRGSPAEFAAIALPALPTSPPQASANTIPLPVHSALCRRPHLTRSGWLAAITPPRNSSHLSHCQAPTNLIAATALFTLTAGGDHTPLQVPTALELSGTLPSYRSGGSLNVVERQ